VLRPHHLHPKMMTSVKRRGPLRQAPGPGNGSSRACGAVARGRRRSVPPPRTKWTRRVPHPVLIGYAASLSQIREKWGQQRLPRAAPPRQACAHRRGVAPTSCSAWVSRRCTAAIIRQFSQTAVRSAAAGPDPSASLGDQHSSPRVAWRRQHDGSSHGAFHRHPAFGRWKSKDGSGGCGCCAPPRASPGTSTPSSPAA